MRLTQFIEKLGAVLEKHGDLVVETHDHAEDETGAPLGLVSGGALKIVGDAFEDLEWDA